MSANISISKIKFSDSSEISFEKSGITVFVGPNNAGKSAVLRDIHQALHVKNGQGIVAKDIEIEKEGDDDELIKFLNLNANKEMQTTNPLPFYKGFQFNVHEQNAKNYWNNYKNGLDGLINVFVGILDTQGRLGMVNPPQNIPLHREYPQHPIHLLQRDDKLESKFNDYFKQAFGMDIILNRGAGNEVPIHVGVKPLLDEGEDRISASYIKKIETLPTLHNQGDGMKSFVGILLNTIISHKSIFLIDEPEAFLHPPQARLLGKMIAGDLPKNKQLFLATHSEDFLNGLLDISKNNIKIIRIGRDGDNNNVCELNNADIKKAWGDPLLRFSNILSGLFHKKVVICEGDADCRFYSATLNSSFEKDGKTTPDILFVHCGGKHRMPVAIKALKKLNVPISIIVDFDVLSDKNPLLKIVDEIGGDWAQFDSEWRIVKAAIDSKKSEVEVADLKSKIDDIFATISGKVLSKDKQKEIESLLKKASPWAVAKETGKSFIPSGDATVAFNALNIKLNSLGIFIVDGILESFVKSIANHGPKWVNEVLEKKDLANDSELENARVFIEEVIK